MLKTLSYTHEGSTFQTRFSNFRFPSLTQTTKVLNMKGLYFEETSLLKNAMKNHDQMHELITQQVRAQGVQGGKHKLSFLDGTAFTVFCERETSHNR